MRFAGQGQGLAEIAALLAVANEPRFAWVPPARIVPMLAAEGVYLGSEYSMARLLHEYGQNGRRAGTKAQRHGHPLPTLPRTPGRCGAGT